MQSWNFNTQKESYEKIRSPKKTCHSLYPAENIHSRKNYLDITALIRSLQRAEGEQDCFRSSNPNCQMTDCRWREYCFEK